MNRAERRAAAKGNRSHPLDCGCEHLGLFVLTAMCPVCRVQQSREMWSPTSAQVGEYRESGFSCTTPDCFGEIEGQALVMATRSL